MISTKLVESKFKHIFPSTVAKLASERKKPSIPYLWLDHSKVPLAWFSISVRIQVLL